MKKTLLQKLALLMCGTTVLSMIGCAATARQSKSGEIYYLKYNFHYTSEKGKAKGSIANYTRLRDHEILPYGTAVKIKSSGETFKLIDEQSGIKIDVLAKKKYLAGMNISDYLDLILSTSPVRYSGLSEIDQKGISAGRPYKGMTKKGVMIALGYPCPSATSSPDLNVWFYWTNRFAKYPVNFKDGVVVSSGY
jgi:hypothetical protein